MVWTQHTDALLSRRYVLSIAVSVWERADVREVGVPTPAPPSNNNPYTDKTPHGHILSIVWDKCSGETKPVREGLPGTMPLTSCLEVEEAGSHRYQGETEGCRAHRHRSWCSDQNLPN